MLDVLFVLSVDVFADVLSFLSRGSCDGAICAPDSGDMVVGVITQCNDEEIADLWAVERAKTHEIHVRAKTLEGQWFAKENSDETRSVVEDNDANAESSSGVEVTDAVERYRIAQGHAAIIKKEVGKMKSQLTKAKSLFTRGWLP